jgi:hypothetical protein
MNKEKALQVIKQLIDKSIENGGIFKNIEDVMVVTQAFQYLINPQDFEVKGVVKKEDIKN